MRSRTRSWYVQIDLTFIPTLKPVRRLPQDLLSICAVVSLALGFFQDFGTTRPDGDPPVDWVEGVAIIVAVLIVIGVGSINDWQKKKQFEALREERRTFHQSRPRWQKTTDSHTVCCRGRYRAPRAQRGYSLRWSVHLSSQCAMQRIECDRQVGRDQEAPVSGMYRTQE